MDRRSFLQLGISSLLLAPSGGAMGGLHMLTPNRGINVNGEGFVIGGISKAWYSGEVHYFRTPSTEWRSTFQLLREAGANCVATYLPWMFLEPERGRYAVTGEHSFEQIALYLKLAQEAELYVFARPGPFCGSELRTGGLPEWLYEDPSFIASDIEGRPMKHRPMSYMHPVYREKAWEWFRRHGD